MPKKAKNEVSTVRKLSSYIELWTVKSKPPNQSKHVTVTTCRNLLEDKNGQKNCQKLPERAKNAFFLISTVSKLSSFVELWTVKFTWPTVLPDLAKKVPKCQKSVTRIGKKLPKWQKSWLLLNYEQCSWPDQTVLPDLAKSCQSSKKVLQEMAKCGQGSQSYTLYTICFTLYALHFTLYTLRYTLYASG